MLRVTPNQKLKQKRKQSLRACLKIHLINESEVCPYTEFF